jgi:tetratricopeptide (TPR) repeat protein
MTFIVISFSLSLYAQVNYSECFDSYKQGDYVEAIVCFSKYIDQNPKDAGILALRADCYKYVDDYARAFADINEAIKNHNTTTFNKDILYIKRGNLYADVENYDEALNDYATALKINPENTSLLFDRANLYYNLENYYASDADWKEILKIEKDNINASIGIARNMIAKGQIDNAIKELNRLGKIDVRNSYIYQYRAEAYEKNKDYRKAIDDVINWMYYENINRLNEHILIGYAEHEPIYALAKVSEKVVTAEEDKIYWLGLRTSLYEEREMYKEAIADYNTIENLSSSPLLNVYLRRGRCYNKIGEYDKAIAEFHKGLELQEHKSLYKYKANAERLKGDYESSIADYTKVIELNPMDNHAYYMRGRVKELKKDFQGALKDYTIAIEIDKDYVYTYVARGRLYQRELNKPELADKDFQAVLMLDNNILSSGNRRQYALFHLGRIDEAISYQDSILSKYPTSGNYYDAVCLYSLINRPSDAITYLRTAFEKGYCNFIHMEHDTDLDNIRNTPEYIELVKEWKNKADKTSTALGKICENNYR